MDRGLYIAGVGSAMLARRLDDVAHNLANAMTPGYRASYTAFTSHLVSAKSRRIPPAAFVAADRQAIDLRSAPIRHTGHPLDFALRGEGFFRIRLPDGTEGLTRAGNFHLDAEGRLVDAVGRPVLDDAGREIRLPTTEISVDGDGRIFAGEVQVAALGLATVTDASRLEKRPAGALFAPAAFVRPAPDATRVVQGALEGSNVEPVLEMTRLITLMRQNESDLKLVERYAEMEKLLTERVGVVQI